MVICMWFKARVAFDDVFFRMIASFVVRKSRERQAAIVQSVLDLKGECFIFPFSGCKPGSKVTNAILN